MRGGTLLVDARETIQPPQGPPALQWSAKKPPLISIERNRPHFSEERRPAGSRGLFTGTDLSSPSSRRTIQSTINLISL